MKSCTSIIAQTIGGSGYKGGSTGSSDVTTGQSELPAEAVRLRIAVSEIFVLQNLSSLYRIKIILPCAVDSHHILYVQCKCISMIPAL